MLAILTNIVSGFISNTAQKWIFSIYGASEDVTKNTSFSKVIKMAHTRFIYENDYNVCELLFNSLSQIIRSEVPQKKAASN